MKNKRERCDKKNWEKSKKTTKGMKIMAHPNLIVS